MANMQKIMQQAAQMQQKMAAVQEQLAEAEISGSAGGGLVTATVSGTGDLKAIKIDPKVVDAEDVETLEDLIVAAVHAASAEASKLAKDTMGPITGALGGLGLPGM